MHGAGGEVKEERLVGCDLLGIGDETDGLVHEVFCEVVALFGRLLRLHLVVVVDEFRIVLVGVAAQKAVEALETAPQGPAVIRPHGGHFMGRGQMPFADGVGVVAVLEQDLGEQAVLERHHPVAAGISRWRLR